MSPRPSVSSPLPRDPLSDILMDLRLSGVSYGRCDLRAPWAFAFPARGPARFHFIVEGEAWLCTSSGEGVCLTAGDIVILPRGAGHHLADARRTIRRPLPEPESLAAAHAGARSFRVRAGGRGARTLLYCASIGLDAPALRPLLALMPPVMHVRHVARHDPILPALLDEMAGEVCEERVGAATVLARLADLVVARTMRAWVEARRDETTGWLAAIRDPQVGRALAAMHQRPGETWSVSSLAREANASRSTFAERFAAVVGMPPARYLAQWRMHLASEWMRDGQLTVAQAAARLGYDSEPAFSRAFRRVVGIPPSAVRRSTAPAGHASDAASGATRRARVANAGAGGAR